MIKINIQSDKQLSNLEKFILNRTNNGNNKANLNNHFLVNKDFKIVKFYNCLLVFNPKTKQVLLKSKKCFNQIEADKRKLEYILNKGN